MFVDRAHITICSGKGGNGAVTFRREPFVPEGGPDGGDGGRGGNIVFQADENLHTLMDFKYKRKYNAENGENGRRKKQYGKAGQDLIISVPVGTMIIDEETGFLMKDLVFSGENFVAARGGKGGKGNVHFKNSVRQAPNFAESGGFSKERKVILELKLMADVGIIGFPNVGKSTLLSVCTNAKPKIANYHFTTINPNLGVARVYDDSFVMADIAGLIEGAAEGMGLGHKFLKHIERTGILVHVVDISGMEGRDPIEDFKKINEELSSYSKKLSEKPQIVVAGKMDLVEEDHGYIDFKKYVEALGYKVFPVSAPINMGIDELLIEINNLLKSVKHAPAETIPEFDFEKEDSLDDFKSIYARRENDIYILEGMQLTKIFNSTNFNDMGSLRYLFKYIESSGGLKKLRELGLEEGDTIKIENYEFEYVEEY